MTSKAARTFPRRNFPELFIQLTDDLSYARTFYPESKTTQYLNELSIRVHHEIYKNKKERRPVLSVSGKPKCPLVMARNRRNLLVAFLTFALAFAAGRLSGTRDNTYVNLMLGDSYVNNTLENIEKGEPMDIYGSMSEGPMFLYIAYNNIKVSFTYFVFGFLFSGGILVFPVQRRIADRCLFSVVLLQKRIGAGPYRRVDPRHHRNFHHHHRLLRGYGLGQFHRISGTYKRSVSLLNGMKDGIKIVIGLVPCFILAALLEGFVTRHYDVDVFLSVAIIVASLVFILWYFVFYPMYVADKTKQQELLSKSVSSA